ncbi:hypothetical protein DO72_4478 [Burkholderia pseudomallei]|nr:hypothetical protein DO66_6100 [Burkholderia pseudomallei]KGD40257.1 hypothetical protein DO72_4478 [Burkholderia pseudomallei]
MSAIGSGVNSTPPSPIKVSSNCLARCSAFCNGASNFPDIPPGRLNSVKLPSNSRNRSLNLNTRIRTASGHAVASITLDTNVSQSMSHPVI